MSSPRNWSELIHRAVQRRQELIADASTDSFRLFHGYGEGCPGLVIEKFGDLIVIDHKFELEAEAESLVKAIDKVIESKVIITKGHQSLRTKLKKRFIVRKGKLEEANISCQERGIPYDIRPNTPHNLGLYFDTRDSRAWLRKNSADCRVLNLFAFTGSLGLSSILGGAKEVVHLDRSAELLSRMQSNYELNGKKWDGRSFLKGDIYKHLPRAIKAGKKFDGIILDPPPKVYSSPHASNAPRGQDFGQLVHLCSQLLSEQGWLMCFFHRFDLSRDQFENEVLKNTHLPLLVSERLSSGIDFPEDNPEHKLRVSIFTRASSQKNGQPTEV
ncbi:MAG: hypothetical protein CMP10_18185 [Zetaproteobacteria bacterium]|mgnify:CR=1 FL=1|nr:hypothetical protein [Pseudobdellovibrionaceae bacterium]